MILVSNAKPGFKLWVDPKTGLMLKAEFTPPSSDKAIIYFEVTEVRLEPSAPLRSLRFPRVVRPSPKRQKSSPGPTESARAPPIVANMSNLEFPVLSFRLRSDHAWHGTETPGQRRSAQQQR